MSFSKSNQSQPDRNLGCHIKIFTPHDIFISPNYMELMAFSLQKLKEKVWHIRQSTIAFLENKGGKRK